MKRLSVWVLCLLCACLTELQAQETKGKNAAGSAKNAYSKSAYFGLGSGLPYGWNGFNIELPLYRKLYVTAGLGLIYMRLGSLHQHLTSPAYNVGLQLNLSAKQNWQRKLIALYGINDFSWRADQQGFSKRSYSGVSLGLSNSYMFGRQQRNGFSIDVLYIPSQLSGQRKAAQEGPLRLGFAYRRKIAP